MGQKLQFVTTVLHEPGLIILDEPFSGLDPVNSNLIKEEIFKLAKAGSTIIFSTHRMEQVEEICDQIILINKGRKILDGKVDTVKQQFKENLYLLQTDSEQIPVTHGFTIKERDGHEWIIQLNEHTSVNEMLTQLIANNVNIKGFNEILPSLNDIFIRLVNGSQSASRQFQPVTA